MLFKAFTALALFSSTVVVKALPAATLDEIAELTGRATPLTQVITQCTVPNTVALTFDDGPYLYLNVCKMLVLPPGLLNLPAVCRTSRMH